MADTILVTGATGTVGGEVVKQLSNVKSDFKIKAAVHSVENAKKIQNFQRVEPILINHETQEGLQAAFKDADKLFLLTHSSPKSAEYERNLITEAKKSGIRHIVKQSIIGADLKADVEAMRLHRQEEKIIENSGIPYTFLRPNAFIQNFVNFYGHIIKAQNQDQNLLIST
jgi:uncharacterized protein YbjT (DUF2867 family)